MKPIPYGKQNIDDSDIKAVVEVLKSDFLTQGPEIIKFEEAFAEYIESKFAVAVSNGTAALHLCAMAMNVKAGDKVITSPITFAASANCVRYCGGEIVFADIDPENFLLDINSVRDLLEKAPEGSYSGIIPVDFAGRPVEMEAFKKLADEYNLWIIEDSCHAPGGYFIDQDGKKQNCGNGNFADLAIFSFHPVKHIAAGEGGMITTNDQEIYQKLISLRTHGITKNDNFYQNEPSFACGIESDEFPGWYMEMHELGYNYRLSDIQAALGRSQISKASSGLNRRKEIAKRYYEQFESKKYILNQSGIVEGHAYHLYIIEVEDRLSLYNYLRENQIYCQVHYIPCHLMPYYKKLGWKEGDLPHAENYYKNCLSLPMYPSLTDEEQSYVIQKIMDFFNE